MKNTFKKMPLILYLCLFGLIFSCSPEQDLLKSPQKNSRITQKPFKELLLLNSFNKAYEKVKTEKQKNLASRSALEDEFNFTISEKEPVKILEMDNKSYYNILIERAVVDSTYFENLFLIIDNSVAVEDVSAYIVKYTPSTISHNTTHHSFNFQGDIKVNPLVQRMTYNCYTVCVTICHDLVQNSEYSEPHVLGIYCTGNNTTEECSTECKWTNDGGSSSDEDASTGQSDTGFGTNTSGGGSSSAGNASSPPNDCGVCNPHLPVVPVKDLPEDEDFGPKRKPCEELNAMIQKPIANTSPPKTVLTNLLDLKNNVTTNKERMYVMNPTSLLENQYIEHFYDSEINGDYASPEFNNDEVSIIAHSHWNTLRHLSTFSLDDIYQIYSSMVIGNITLASNTFTSIVITAHGTQYALKIGDKATFIAWGDTFFANWGFEMDPGIENPLRKISQNIYYEKYEIGLGNTPEQIAKNEKALTKFLMYEGVGLELYKADDTFSQWSKLSISIFNSLKETPCLN